MINTRRLLLAASLLAGSAGTLAYAQPATPDAAAATYDPAQLPAIQGKVAQYSLTPRGDVDGLILQDGTQVHFPPHMSAALVFAVRPGDAVTVHGLKARVLPLVMALSVSNDATHQTVTAEEPHGPMAEGEPRTEIDGQIKAPLYGPHGEVDGVLLADGTEVRLPPPEAAKLGDMLAAGKTVVVRGEAIESPLGKVVLARAIGPDKKDLTRIAMPHPGGPGFHHGHHHGPAGEGPGDEGPQGPGLNGNALPPPAQ